MKSYFLLSEGDGVDKDTGAQYHRVTVGTGDTMVPVSVRIPGGKPLLPADELKRRKQMRDFVFVGFIGLAIDKAWAGFGGNNPGFVFSADRAVIVDANGNEVTAK